MSPRLPSAEGQEYRYRIEYIDDREQVQYRDFYADFPDWFSAETRLFRAAEIGEQMVTQEYGATFLLSIVEEF